MSGFPNRPARIVFGPQMKNKRPPVIAETDLNANQMNLDFWQVAGAGRVVAMAVILFDGVTPAIISQALAFDPRQELEDIAFVKNATGDYTFTFASTYKDEQGNDVSFAPRFSMAQFQGGTPGDKATPFDPSGQDVLVRVRNAAEALIDGTFMLQVW